MTKIFNKWLESYRRSFDSIKFKLLQDLDNIKDDQGNPLITDKSEGNILVLIISMFSAIAEVLHFYIDKTGRESFLPTATMYNSLVRHAQLVDYHVKGAVASQTQVSLSRDSSNANSALIIKSTDQIIDNVGNTWMPKSDYVFPENSTYKIITLIQHSPVLDETHTLQELVNERYIPITVSSDGLYEEGSMTLQVGEDEYTLVETFAKSSPTDKHFIVEAPDTVSSNNILIVFGDGVNGYKPLPSGVTLRISYFMTQGSNGNISSNGINTTYPGASTITVVNFNNSGGGSSYENFDILKQRIKNSVKTLDIAISKEDFKDLALTRSGVSQAAVEYECGRKLNVYIATNTGDASGICEDVKNYLLAHCPITTWLSVKPVGTTYIMLDISVTGHKSYKSNYIHDQVVEALNNRYSVHNSEIGGSVRLSDIYALIDNLPSVDYLRVNKFYLKPWPKILRGVQLIIGTYNLTQCNNNMEYLLEVNENSSFNVYSKYGGFHATTENLNNLSVNDTINGVSFTMTFSDEMVSSLQTGYKYSIYITQNSLDYEEPGYNIPAFSEKDLKLNITEVL